MELSVKITNDIGKMSQLLNEMELKGKVDPSILDIIKSLQAEVSQFEQRMRSDGKEVRSRFLSYHILRNLNLILSRMVYRFENAEKAHDNPVVAEDSLAILAFVSQTASMAIQNGGRKLTQKQEEDMIEAVRTLREKAFDVSMLINPNEETEGLDKEALKQEGKRIATTIQHRYIKDENLH